MYDVIIEYNISHNYVNTLYYMYRGGNFASLMGDISSHFLTFLEISGKTGNSGNICHFCQIFTFLAFFPIFSTFYNLCRIHTVFTICTIISIYSHFLTAPSRSHFLPFLEIKNRIADFPLFPISAKYIQK